MEESISLASQAVAYDKENHIDAAIYFYTQAAQSILENISKGIAPASFREKVEQYISRAEALRSSASQVNLQPLQRTCCQADLEKAEFLLGQALDEDEKGNGKDAIELYSDAVALCIDAIKVLTDLDSADLKKKLEALAARALERAENLKQNSLPESSTSNFELNEFDRLSITTTTNSGVSPSVSPQLTKRITEQPRDPTTAGQRYSTQELEVLRITSMVNAREYVPFLSVDLHERFAFPIPFNDKHGLLALSSKQKRHFLKWLRPSEFISDACIISRVNSTSIKQTVVSDCSFVASLAIAARYEERFKKRLISSIIYPQSKSGDPMVNPCGKYMIKFHFNGINRKVVIDDYLPIGRNGELLCSFSNNRTELWVSLLEKAYMKIMGGYDFPGSNSNIDLHVLTGWIPERIAISSKEKEFDRDAIFNKLFQRFHAGDCLATVATGKMTEAESERTGLVDCHAYAMLDIRQIQGLRLFLLKNPWNHVRWKGRLSERDADSWTPALCSALRYDRKSAQQIDDGEFWIDFDSVCHFFDVFYVNWKPSLFSFTNCVHGLWNAGLGPTKDLYNIGENPQHSLEVRNNGAAAVWILLTRHIIDKDDFENNREYITVLVYKSNGKRIYYPFDPPPIVDGTRINSPHYLCKLNIDPENSPQTASRFTLVVSQYEKTTTIFYTLRVYATCEINLKKLENNYRHRKKEPGEWKGKSAGGCANSPETWRNNPTYELTCESMRDDVELFIDLRGPKQFNVGLDFIPVKCSSNFSRKSSGSFRSGFCVLTLENVPSGTYNIVPATFLPGQEGPYFLNVMCNVSFSLRRLQ